MKEPTKKEPHTYLYMTSEAEVSEDGRQQASEARKDIKEASTNEIISHTNYEQQISTGKRCVGHSGTSKNLDSNGTLSTNVTIEPEVNSPILHWCFTQALNDTDAFVLTIANIVNKAQIDLRYIVHDVDMDLAVLPVDPIRSFRPAESFATGGEEHQQQVDASQEFTTDSVEQETWYQKALKTHGTEESKHNHSGSDDDNDEDKHHLDDPITSGDEAASEDENTADDEDDLGEEEQAFEDNFIGTPTSSVQSKLTPKSVRALFETSERQSAAFVRGSSSVALAPKTSKRNIQRKKLRISSAGAPGDPGDDGDDSDHGKDNQPDNPFKLPRVSPNKKKKKKRSGAPGDSGIPRVSPDKTKPTPPQHPRNPKQYRRKKSPQDAEFQSRNDPAFKAAQAAAEVRDRERRAIAQEEKIKDLNKALILLQESVTKMAASGGIANSSHSQSIDNKLMISPSIGKFAEDFIKNNPFDHTTNWFTQWDKFREQFYGLGVEQVGSALFVLRGLPQHRQFELINEIIKILEDDLNIQPGTPTIPIGRKAVAIEQVLFLNGKRYEISEIKKPTFQQLVKDLLVNETVRTIDMISSPDVLNEQQYHSVAFILVRLMLKWAAIDRKDSGSNINQGHLPIQQLKDIATDTRIPGCNRLYAIKYSLASLCRTDETKLAQRVYQHFNSLVHRAEVFKTEPLHVLQTALNLLHLQGTLQYVDNSIIITPAKIVMMAIDFFTNCYPLTARFNHHQGRAKALTELHAAMHAVPPYEAVAVQALASVGLKYTFPSSPDIFIALLENHARAMHHHVEPKASNPFFRIYGMQFYIKFQKRTEKQSAMNYTEFGSTFIAVTNHDSDDNNTTGFSMANFSAETFDTFQSGQPLRSESEASEDDQEDDDETKSETSHASAASKTKALVVQTPIKSKRSFPKGKANIKSSNTFQKDPSPIYGINKRASEQFRQVEYNADKAAKVRGLSSDLRQTILRKAKVIINSLDRQEDHRDNTAITVVTEMFDLLKDLQNKPTFTPARAMWNEISPALNQISDGALARAAAHIQELERERSDFR